MTWFLQSSQSPHSGCKTFFTLPSSATRTSATALWFLMTGVTENTVPDCVFCTRAMIFVREALPSAIRVSCSEDRATCGTSLNTSTFGVHLSRSEEHTSELQSQSNLVCR